MSQLLRVLIVEDNPVDAELLVRAMRSAGFDCECQLVDTEAEYVRRLEDPLDLILSDYDLPQFSGLRALELLKARRLDVPFIVVSGAIGEETAVAAMKLGAADYLLKDRLARLGPSVSHALEEACLRRERKQAGEALRLAEARYHSIFENAVHGIFQATPEGAFLMVNPAMARILGFETPEELLRERPEIWSQRFVDQARQDEYKRRVAECDRVAGFECEVVRKDGSRVWISENTSVIRDAAGRITYYEGTVAEITERRRAEEGLRLANDRYRSLATRIQSIREQERTAIAREIHDVLAQELTRLKIDLVWLGKRLARPIDEALRPALAQRLADATAQTDLAITTVQSIATELRPVILDSLGLSAAVEWQTEDFGRRTGLVCRATAPQTEPVLDRDRSTALFRILQESLTNIARHAHATAVDVVLAEERGAITLTVQDDGRGITKEEVSDPRSIGLIGMSERAQAFGGTVRIALAPGGGTVVTVEIPLENQRRPLIDTEPAAVRRPA